MEKADCQLCSLKSTAAQRLNEKEICLLGDNCATVHFQEGDLIIRQNAFSTNVAYIKTGLAKIHVKEKILKIEGRKITVLNELLLRQISEKG
jgi:hypothetical protein